MILYIALSLFVLGTIIGSFLNVVILRFNSGKTLGGRSGCFSCGKTLAYYELLPIVSYAVLRGKCSVCRTQISKQYPLVELSTGVMFVGLFYFYLPTFSVSSFSTFLFPLFITYGIWCVLVVIFVYDLKHKIIPDFFSFLFTFLALVHVYITAPYELLSHIGAGAILFLFFFGLWFVSKGTWMGFGDAKLGFGIGAYLGVAQGISAAIVGFWSGAIVAVLTLVLQNVIYKMGTKGLRTNLHTVTMKSEIPFAPFLIFGILIALLFSLDLFHLQLFFS